MKRIPIIIFLTAITIGLFLLFDKCSTDQTRKPDKEYVMQCESEMGVSNIPYQNATVLLQKQGYSLQKELYQTQLQGQQPQFNVVVLSEKDTLAEGEAPQFIDCDSLKEQAFLFTNFVDSTKCDYEVNITQANNLLAIKDSQIVIYTVTYSQLMNSAVENLQLEQNLAKDLETAYKQQRKNRIQNKVLAAGCLILSAITATLVIHSRK